VVALESTGQLKGGSRAEDRRPRIAICDYIVSARSPIGSCHIALMQSLCESIDFTVFAADFVNPRPDRIRFVKVPVPTRPLALLFSLSSRGAACFLLDHARPRRTIRSGAER
jgi:hypothetical protein